MRETWNIVELVSHGGLSLVYRLADRHGHAPAALKCYVGLAELPEPTREAFREGLTATCDLLGRLSMAHPALVRTYGLGWLPMGEGKEAPCLLLEWLEGSTLEKILDIERESGFHTRTPGEVLSIMAAPMAALAAAHDHGLVHRDIKPSNVFVSGDALAPDVPIKVLDFRLAKSTAGDAPALALMTPNYAAPEQFQGAEARIGPWTDVFGFALVLVELMLGGHPALRGRDFEALQRASEDEHSRPTPGAFGLEVSNVIEGVFKRALAVDPEDRYPNMRAFAEALEAAVQSDGRVGSSRITRVAGVLEVGEDTGSRRGPPTQPPATAADSGVRRDPAARGGTVAAPAPAVTGETVIAPAPVRSEE